MRPSRNLRAPQRQAPAGYPIDYVGTYSSGDSQLADQAALGKRIYYVDYDGVGSRPATGHGPIGSRRC